MSKKRRQHSAELKTRVALEALKGIEPVHAIAAKYKVHPVQVSQWKIEPSFPLGCFRDVGRRLPRKHLGQPLQQLLLPASAAADGSRSSAAARATGTAAPSRSEDGPVRSIAEPDGGAANQVWAMDITYIPIEGGFLYLCAVIDWYSRAVLAWDLSNTLDARFCVETVQRAIDVYGPPDIFNTDQGCQFTSLEFTTPLLALGVKLSMDGKGRALDNVFVERLWRTVKWDEVYRKSYRSQIDAYTNLDRFFRFYNEERPHSAFPGDVTPMEIYQTTAAVAVNQ